MGLTEFLLARIAEDEAPTYELVPYGCGAWCCAPPGWVGHRCLICDTPAEFGGTVAAITEIAREHEEKVHRHSRVLADCEARRRIVGELQNAERMAAKKWHRKIRPEVDEYLRSMTVAAFALACVHYDHPDFRQEWGT